MKLVSRAAWRARSRSTSTNITPGNGGVSIHYVGASHINDSHGNCAQRVRNIQNFHIDGRSWADIAYSLLVCAHGYVYVGRGINRRTAANGTNAGNQSWYAVCALIGGSQQPTAAMVQGIKDAVAYLRRSGGAASRVNGHRDHLSTSCPGNPLYAMVRNGTFGSGGSGGGGGGGGSSSNPYGTRSAEDVQKAVNSLGYTPPLAEDNDYGTKTHDGVEWVQRNRFGFTGAAADGKWGSGTEAAYTAYMEDDVPDRRYLSTTSETRLRRGEWTQIQLGDPNEWSLAGVSSSPQRFVAEVGWRIDGLSEDDEYQVRLCNYDPPTGGGSWQQAGGRRISEHRHKDGLALDSRTFIGQVNATQRVRVEIKQWTSDEAVLLSTNSDTLTWDL